MLLNLFYDLQRGILVSGEQNPRQFTLPPFYAGDTVELTIRALLPTGVPDASYTVVPITALLLSFAYVVDGSFVDVVNTDTFVVSGDGLAGSFTIPQNVTIPASLAYQISSLAAQISTAGGVSPIESPAILRNPSFPIQLPNVTPPWNVAAQVPAGGTTGQVLGKTAGTDYATGWLTPAASGVTSVNTRTGAVTLSAADVGLGSVNNTSDAAKPVSTAQQTALDLKASLASPTLTGVPTAPTPTAGTNTTQLATTAFVSTLVSTLTSGAPGSLDTFLEAYNRFLADESAASALTATVGGKLTAAANLSDLANAVTARTSLGLGTAATKDVGTGAGNVPVLDGAGKLPTSTYDAGGGLSNVSQPTQHTTSFDGSTPGDGGGTVLVQHVKSAQYGLTLDGADPSNGVFIGSGSSGVTLYNQVILYGNLTASGTISGRPVSRYITADATVVVSASGSTQPDCVFVVDSSAGPVTITCPTLGLPAGGIRTFRVIDAYGTSGANPITFATSGASITLDTAGAQLLIDVDDSEQLVGAAKLLPA